MTRTGEVSADAPVVAAFNPETAAREPVEFGIAASRVTGAPLVVVAVQPGGALVSHLTGHADEGTSKTVRHLRVELERRKIRADVREFHDNTAGRGLTRAIDDLRPQLVVVGMTDRGHAGAALLGTTAERVIHASRCAVAVVPHGYERPEAGIRRVGAAYAPTAEGREALRAAVVLARVAGGTAKVIRVLDPKHAAQQSHGMMARQHHDTAPEEDIEARARLEAEEQFAEDVAAIAHDTGNVELDVLFNDPAAGLLAAGANVDLLVMGSRAHGPRRSVVLGSVSRRLVERAPCPVLVIPRGTESEAEVLLAHTHAVKP